jgi:hypothetical protein
MDDEMTEILTKILGELVKLNESVTKVTNGGRTDLDDIHKEISNVDSSVNDILLVLNNK